MSQFRKDPVSGEWVISAPERSGKRPNDFRRDAEPRKSSPKKTCPFENPEKTGNWPPVLRYDEKGKWEAIVIQNKFPALMHAEKCPGTAILNGYEITDGYGYHELLLGRDHDKNFADISKDHAFNIFKMFADRYRSIDQDKCMAYLSIFCNWGPTAGASMSHPHYQLMALPVLPPNVIRSYQGSERYFKKNKRCVHCDLIKEEIKGKKRVILETKEAVAIAPFVSHSSFEVRIFPKKHIPAFEKSRDEVLKEVSTMLQKVLQRIKKKLNDPDLNFYIHTTPLRNQDKLEHYHWHIEVLPKITKPAGFELATGIDVNVIDPDTAAKILR